MAVLRINKWNLQRASNSNNWYNKGTRKHGVTSEETRKQLNVQKIGKSTLKIRRGSGGMRS